MLNMNARADAAPRLRSGLWSLGVGREGTRPARLQMQRKERKGGRAPSGEDEGDPSITQSTYYTATTLKFGRFAKFLLGRNGIPVIDSLFAL